MLSSKKMVNDIIKSCDKFEFTIYADDTTLFYTQTDLTNLGLDIARELAKVSRWFKANKLIINKKKKKSNDIL